jgi:hypothetical protein
MSPNIPPVQCERQTYKSSTKTRDNPDQQNRLRE